MRHLLRYAAAIAVVAIALGFAYLAATTFAPGSWVARGAPCPRNWGWAPAWQPRASPLLDADATLADGHVRVCYGAPSLRGRVMLGGTAVPWGRLWRTGANEPTTLHTDVPVTLGGVELGPGSYALYTVPGPETWDVIVNRSTRQWGLESEYTSKVAAQELGRFQVTAEALPVPVERLRIATEATPTGLDLVLSWQTTRLRMPVRAGT
jgi:hypothetical protein